MHYFATGEGQIFEIKTLSARNKKEACDLHMKAFNYTEDERNYYGRGVEALLVTNTKVDAIVKGLLTNGDQLISAIRRGTADVHFKLEQNES